MVLNDDVKDSKEEYDETWYGYYYLLIIKWSA